MATSWDQFVVRIGSVLATDQTDRNTIARVVTALDEKYNLSAKLTREPGVGDILLQLMSRLVSAFGHLSEAKGKRVLDIACGSNSSKLPASFYLRMPWGQKSVPSPDEYTAQFEPWMCRILLELGADPVGIDFGNLDAETFQHYRVDLGLPGALDFLPSQSFDALQDSRLFGSPEFTAEFPDSSDRLKVASEIRRQERRLLKPHGIIIHSDARDLVG